MQSFALFVLKFLLFFGNELELQIKAFDPDNQTYLTLAWDGNEYLISREYELTWPESYRTCSANNYSAISFDSKEEFEMITEKLESLGYANETNGFWTGGYALRESMLEKEEAWADAFYWLPNLKKIDSGFWDRDEPNNSWEDQRCAQILNQNNQKFHLDDNHCWEPAKFICKRKAHLTLNCH